MSGRRQWYERALPGTGDGRGAQQEGIGHGTRTPVHGHEARFPWSRISRGSCGRGGSRIRRHRNGSRFANRAGSQPGAAHLDHAASVIGQREQHRAQAMRLVDHLIDAMRERVAALTAQQGLVHLEQAQAGAQHLGTVAADHLPQDQPMTAQRRIFHPAGSGVAQRIERLGEIAPRHLGIADSDVERGIPAVAGMV